MPVEGDVVASRDGDEDEYPVPPTDGTGFEEEVMKKVSDLGTITQGLAPVVNGNADTLPRDAGKQADGNTAFLRAARAGNLDKVLEYLKSNIDINTSNANGLNALHLASKDGHVNVVTELLKRGATVDAATKKGNTALHIASLAGQEEVVKILVQNGASVNVQSQNGFTPLYMAAQENHDNVVRFLLANGANQSLATEDGFTPLAVAMQQGHDKVVTVLLENDTRGKVRLPALHIAAKKDDCKAAALLLQNDHNPDVTSKSGFTPLHIAAHYGNENIANLLLQRGADVNYSAKHNITPLHVAAKWGKTNMVSLLIEKGANIEAKTRDGLTPLHCAARSGHEQVVDMLLERGAPISSKTKNGLAPLHMASQGDHVDAARILLYHRAPVDEVTVDYLTALHVAAHCGHVRVAKLLLDRKADPNARALNGFTPLHIACKKNRIKVVELLLKHGASIEATTESGLTPLHVASFMGCMNIVIYLIQHEANPDVPTVRGETPLHLAARANQADIIRILLRNGAQVDARAREQQTPLHIASRLGNVDIVMLLLQHGAAVDATTKDMYTALHIAAKEGQEEVASVLLEHGASLTATTKKGFTPLHLAAKYGKMKVARLLLQRDAPVDAQGKNGVTPLHVASHYDHQNVALLLLDKGASPHATAKNGHTPLHIAARKNQMDIATTLLEYGAKANAESKAGFTPLHLSSQEGHTDMSTLLIEHQADPNHKAKNGLTPLHLCAQEDRVNVATILVKNGAEVDAKTKAGYTPLHVACHFGQINMVRFLLQHGVDVNSATSAGYTPLHQAAQQGHVLIINLLLESRASPNAVTNQGQTALSIAQKLGYISVVETLKVVTETVITTTTTITTEEKYRVMAPETMQETFMSDSEDEGGEDTMLSDQPYRYLTVDEMKSLGDDSLPIDVTRDERGDSNRDSMAPPTAMEDSISPQHSKEHYSQFSSSYAPDNVDIARHPVHVGKLQWKTFLVSFMVDARGGAMRGCRHSGVRVIVPPRKAAMPMRITCRYLKKDKLAHPPPLMEGEALASRILELGPVAAKFLGPVIIEVPHFGSLRGKEREIVILRSDNGETWREHTLEASEEAIQDVLNESFDGEELTQLEDLNTNRITRILTTDFPQYFAIVSRVRQEVHAIGPEGGMVSSTVVPQVQAVFPQGALTKKIKVGLQAQPISAELVAKLLGNRVAVSPIVTVEPRRRKFHKPITLTIPVPQAANKGMINQYSGDAPTLRLLCSITGGTTRAQWEDVTGSTPLTFVNDCVSFTTTVSARFWLMDCRNIAEATKMATELYKEAIHVPFMAKFVVFAKRVDVLEARLRVFCMTDDKEDKTLEHQEHFTEVAKSRDVEVLEGKSQFVEFAGNLVPVTKSGDQLQLGFHAFKENRLPFTVRVKDPHADTVGRILFMREPKVAKGEPPQSPICILNIVLPETITPEMAPSEPDLLELEKKYSFLRDGSLSRTENIHKADLRLSDICNLLGLDWIQLANELGIAQDDIHLIQSEYPDSVPQQAMVMLRLWMQQSGNKATGNTLEKSLRKINREDIVDRCIFNVELVTDDMEKAVAKVRLDQSGFDNLKEELGPSRDTSLRRNVSLDVTYDEQDIMKESESVEELVAAEKIVTPKEDRLAHESEVEAKDSIREKDVGAEKIGDEVRKSIKDYEREEQKYVGEEKEYKEFEEALMKDAPKPVHEEITKKRGHEEVKEAAFVKDESKKSPTIMAGMADDSGDDKKRKADMIAEITEELGRLDTSYKGGAPMPVKEAVTSPKISKTPPPSPAEFKEGTVMSTKVTHEFPARDIVVGEEHTEYITPDGTTVRQTTITKTTIVQGAEPSITEEAAQLAESETWQSDDQSTHPEELSSVQEWAEKMQQKHSAGHGGPATEDAGISPIIPDVALSAMKTTSVQRSVPLDTKTPELGTPAMSSSVTSTTTTTSDALVSDITAPESSKKTSSSPESPALSGVEAAALLTKVSTEQSPKKKDTDKGSSESTTAPTSSMAPQAFPFLSSTSTSADRALVEELTAGGIQAFEVESAFATKHPSSNLDQFETKTEDEVPDLLDDDLNSPEYAKSFIPTTPSKQSESSVKIPEDEPNKIIGEGHKDACSPEDKRARHIHDLKSEFESDTTSQPYVTTPTLQRRSFSRTIAGKIVRGSRPAPLEVVQLSNEDYDGENVTSEQHYTVTEPGDDDDNVDSKTDKWADSTCRVNSSPDLVSLTDPQPLQFIKTVNKDLQNLASFEADLGMGPSGSVEKIPTPQEEKKRPLFRIESSEDEGEILGQYPSKEFDEQLFPLAEPSESVSGIDEKFERRVKKAERRFERIASKSLEEEERASVTGEDEVEETPSARERTREMEFQRMTSQLSTEELAGTEVDFQKVFTELLEEPSEEWDTHSHDLDTPERELDSILPEDDDPKGAVGITCSPPLPPPSEVEKKATESCVEKIFNPLTESFSSPVKPVVIPKIVIEESKDSDQNREEFCDSPSHRSQEFDLSSEDEEDPNFLTTDYIEETESSESESSDEDEINLFEKAGELTSDKLNNQLQSRTTSCDKYSSKPIDTEIDRSEVNLDHSSINLPKRGETGGAEHMTQEDAPATYSTTMRAAAPRRRPPRPIHDISIDDDSDNVECDVREHDWRFDLQTHRAQSQKMGSEFYQTQDPESTSEYDPSQTTTQARVVTTRTLTRTVMGEDGRPVSVTTTETEVSDGGGAEGVLDSNQLRESMQQIIDQFASEEEMKEGKESKEEKKPE
ncbi:ankyrin-3 isoform X28 [Ischnura elegans]|uniref:ankyrin-3 isoform X28 n=1 Tax=Ischnura elegans TaxID=197161 RepID=UPI001ED898E7|nr:ankyrin-3 isoform X28 [Ischnura elegans]